MTVAATQLSPHLILTKPHKERFVPRVQGVIERIRDCRESDVLECHLHYWSAVHEGKIERTATLLLVRKVLEQLYSCRNMNGSAHRKIILLIYACGSGWV